MKTNLSILLLFLSIVVNNKLFAQVKFQRHYGAGSTQSESSNKVVPLQNGNFLIAGASNHASGGAGDLTLLEIDVFGNKVREKAIGNTSWEYIIDVIKTDSSYIIMDKQ